MLKYALYFGSASALILSSCVSSKTIDPYYLDCSGTSENNAAVNPETRQQTVHWVFMVDEQNGKVLAREGENGPYTDICQKDCSGISFSDQFIEWTSRATDPELPGFVAYVHSQIQRKTDRLATRSWVGEDRNLDPNTNATSLTCKRSKNPPTPR